jgi:hypothetical protein
VSPIRDWWSEMAQSAKPIRLMPHTVGVFQAYIRKAEGEMEALRGSGSFLWSDGGAARAQQIQAGQIVAQYWSGKAPIEVPSGLIHDWIGAAFLPDTALEKALALIQDYGNHKSICKPEVMDQSWQVTIKMIFKFIYVYSRRKSSP